MKKKEKEIKVRRRVSCFVFSLRPFNSRSLLTTGELSSGTALLTERSAFLRRLRPLSLSRPATFSGNFKTSVRRPPHTNHGPTGPLNCTFRQRFFCARLWRLRKAFYEDRCVLVVVVVLFYFRFLNCSVPVMLV